MADVSVSVGVATYNHEAYIGECLRSILAQGHRPLEVVVGDDASTDGTLHAIRDAVRDAPIPVHVLPPEPNLGVTGNLNRILRHCRGDLVCIVGGDDVLYPGKVGAQARAMADPGIALSYHDVRVFSDDPSFKARLYSQSHPPRAGGATDLVRHGTFLCAVSAMFRRSAIPAGGFDPALPLAADWMFFIEVARRGRMVYLPQVLAGYRRHPASLSGSGRSDADLFLTLDLLDRRHPEFRRATRLRRADLHHILASKHMAAGDRPEAAREARTALRLRPVWGPTAQAWLLLAAAGIRPSSLRPRRPRP